MDRNTDKMSIKTVHGPDGIQFEAHERICLTNRKESCGSRSNLYKFNHQKRRLL